MRIRDNMSLPGAVFVFLLTLVTLAKFPATVYARDCTSEGGWIGPDCVSQNGCGTTDASACIYLGCLIISGGNDAECQYSCMGRAYDYWSC